MRGHELRRSSDSMTYPAHSLIEARLPPSLGRTERRPREPLPFLLRAGQVPQGSDAGRADLK